MGILSDLHPAGGTVMFGPVKDDEADRLPAFVDHHTKNPPQGVVLVPTISDNGLSASWAVSYADRKARARAVKWSAKVQVKADQEFDWGGSG